jgi:hypothetical protein
LKIHTPRIWVKNTLKPVKIDIKSALTRCSLKSIKRDFIEIDRYEKKISYRIPSNFGFSPGAVFSLIIFNALTCVKAKTVAATNHGKPSNDWSKIEIDRTNKSRW